MRYIWHTALLSLLLLALIFSPVMAQQGIDGRDETFEKEITDRLAKINANAVPIFEAATVSMDNGDLEAAAQGFEKVLEMAPDFPDALRRLGHVYTNTGDYETAEMYMRRALSVEDTPTNKASLASVLLNINTPKSNQEAFNLAQVAASMEPDDAYNQYILMFASITIGNQAQMQSSCTAVMHLEPNEPVAHYICALFAADDGKYELAERELLLAQELGAPPDIVQEALNNGIARMASLYRLGRYGLYGLGGWIFLMLPLFLVGILLSKMTLAAMKRGPNLFQAEISSGERLVRGFYKLVIALTSIYFYLSVPILLLSVVALVAGVLYIFFLIGSIPIRLALIILFAGLGVLYAVIRSVFSRYKPSDPGPELPYAEAPYLWRTLEDTARQLNTRPVEKVFITPGLEIGVFERGSLLARLRGKGERCMVLGLGALAEMDQGQFRAILAHEYGHFSNADTAGGGLARQVGLTIQTMAMGLSANGTNTWINPVWLFLNGYYRIFLRITQGASRLQEMLADRYAAANYGVENFRSGLEHVTRRALMFHWQTNREIITAQAEHRGLNNLYTLPPVEPDTDQQVLLEKARTQRSTAYDSHPSLCERLEYLQNVRDSGYMRPDTRPAWDLLADAPALQEKMTSAIQEALVASNILEIAPGPQAA